MKLLKTTALAVMLASPAFAGGLSEPIEEPVIAPAAIEEDTANNSQAGILVPILAILLIGLAMSGGGGDGEVIENGGGVVAAGN